jgi:prephenate dehydrogenase
MPGPAHAGSHSHLLLETGLSPAENRAVQWNKIALIGVGLLGGSIGLAARKQKLTRSVAGFVRRRARIRECQRVGAVNRAFLDLRQAVTGADLVILCTPIAQMSGLVDELLPLLEKGAVVTDVGSVKASVIEALEAKIEQAGAHFVGSHPMAGSEQTGVKAARADLFESAVCVTTPTARTSTPALRKVERFWRALGSKVLRLSPELHDELVGRSSHLPHLIAAVLAHTVLAPGSPPQQGRLCANGFRDSTRIASGSPEMWRDIDIANRKNLLAALDLFANQLQNVRILLEQSGEQELTKFFEAAKHRRDQWRKRQVSSSPE